MGVLSRTTTAASATSTSTRSSLFAPLLAIVCFSIVLLFEVESYISRTKTIAGHNLDPTPWHQFPAKNFTDESRLTLASKIIQCSYFSCHSSPENNNTNTGSFFKTDKAEKCPEFFRWVHQDLEPWAETGVTLTHIQKAKNHASMRVVIVEGKLYVDLYYACVQSRTMFTVWGFLQLLRRYPGLVPDVDLMFDCMDKPTINRTHYGSLPLPMFRYCTTPDHFDIPFPDWSFWGWPEVNIGAWDEEFSSIIQGSSRRSWRRKWPVAHWKGNPEVSSPIRQELLNCNHSRLWRAQILRQDWEEEAKDGFENSKLSSQCEHRYKIYAEGFAWSVSLKYILSCGSLPLIISPEYEDFFSRGLVPMKNYWPISTTNLCPNIKYAAEWGNAHLREAEAMGKAAQDFMASMNMDRVYDYMFHLLNEYSKLQRFKPAPLSSALEVCLESLYCYADETEKEFLEKSASMTASAPPCTLQLKDDNIIESWLDNKIRVIQEVENYVSIDYI
ncbi:O-glucosyltransferase rumi homolog [Impatiens glandulifera]|uniref:O-glucosyltransferase rumi homolog n=1 Tax=Impatiens glandulifera TaxID=253017 RepID=UPI001FB08996|nr:O-glucosyltransferase rumi homolog [Impatiens glandulifera]